MAFSVQAFGVTDASQTDYTVTITCLKLSHLKVSYADLLGDYGDETDFTFTGEPGNATLTLGAGFGPVALHGTIRVVRDTTLAAAVDFQDAATLREADLDNLYLQNLYLTQEAIDNADDVINRNASRLAWDTNYLKVENLGAPVSANDAARLVDVQNISLDSGNLPAVTVTQNNRMLAVEGGAWAVQTATEIKALLSFGTAADLDFGTGVDDVVKKSVLDTTYLKAASNLTDVGDLATTKATLGVTDVSGLSVGTGVNNLVQLNGSAQYPSNDGSLIDLSSNTVNSGRLLNVGYIAIGSQTPDATTQTPLTLGTLTHLVGDTNGTGLAVPATGFYLAPGKWEVDVSINVKSTSGGTSGTFVWQIYNQTGGGAPYQSASTAVDDTRCFVKSQVFDLTSESGNTFYGIRMEETTASATLQFTEGNITVRRYS